MENNKNLTELLNSLSPKEKEYTLKILKQLSEEGNSQLYNELLYEDYEEIPVSIEEFLHNPEYLGAGLIDEEGRFTVFPYWVETLKKLFPDPLKPSAYNTLALTGSIGIGKSFMAVLCLLYELYRILCLKNPYTYYHLQPIDKITFAFMNITMEASRGVAWDKLQQLLQSSPWFIRHGTITGNVNVEWHPSKRIELISGSLSRHILGRAVFGCFFDEISFQPLKDIEKQKEKAKGLVNTAVARMQSRFMRAGKNPTLLIIASSKQTEQSFMETFIENKKKNESKNTYVVDEPQWVIRTDKNTPEKFKVAIGNKFLESEVLPRYADEQTLQEYIDRGYTLIDVPMSYYENFTEDINIALQDIAGISTTSINKFISGQRLARSKVDDYENPFTREIIEVGNDINDLTEYSEFFDLSRVDKRFYDMPLYIHLDMSISGDKTGIAGSWITGTKPSTTEGRDPQFRLAFHVSVKAPKGRQISFEKNRNFIRWLRQQNFNIQGITADTFQSAQLLQQLSAEGFNCEILSVDRVDSDRICKPYQYFREAMYEGRFLMYKNNHLTKELVELERNNNTGKVDHPADGSKDAADAVCGSVYNASKHTEEFEFNFGDKLDTILQANLQGDSNEAKQQLTVDFEQELMKALNPINALPGDFDLFGNSARDESGLFVL